MLARFGDDVHGGPDTRLPRANMPASGATFVFFQLGQQGLVVDMEDLSGLRFISGAGVEHAFDV